MSTKYKAATTEETYFITRTTVDYYFSSARNYAGLDNDLNIILIDLF
ncbi:hypothetical protein [Flavobacterium aciduliphilum]|uniref:Uncharacterized protein n=1 Tax=Flavobacterium aciduliphilum TaxID=1101402 RepID=A0A328YPW5_9FLAO|nr:hypothetical protein [Flavobacterium aciduliphilum]RAR75404.1 hypothetical protein CLV55_10199 [Flavobacterium aciduliphilum]